MMKEFVTLPFRPAARPPWYGPLGYAVTIAGLALATGVMHALLPIVSLASTYLVYLVIVVAVSVGWGLKQGMLAAILAFLAANFYFTQPLFTFAVAAVQDAIALLTFLGLAILTSQLVARLRREAQDARQGQQTTATLYALSQTLTGQQSLPTMLDEAASQLHTVLDLAACRITVAEPGRQGSVTASIGAVAEAGVRAGVRAGTDWEEASARMVTVPLAVGSQPGGFLQMLLPPDRPSLTSDEQRMVAAFTEQLQVAIERAQLQHASVQTEVLRRTDALRSALLSAVAHDVRTPLASIKSAATSLLSTRVEWGKEEQQSFLNAIVEEVDHINRIVGNLLDMSRIEAGRMQPHKEPHRIGDVIETVVERLRSVLLDHPLSIEVEPDLQAVPMDEVQIDEVLTNLLENAAKHTPAGTPVEVRAYRQEDAIAVDVVDGGPGIAPEHLPHLFSRFYRVTAGSANGPPGSGLGLAIVKAIVEAHGGQVSAANTLGGGAVFRFTLPLCSMEEPGAEGVDLPSSAIRLVSEAANTNRSFPDGETATIHPLR